jgi:ribosomal protein L12E/L44/L45/RPP1/RPP2
MSTISSQAKLKGLLKLKELLKKLKDLLKLKELLKKLKELTTPMSSPHPHNSKADEEADKAITSKICHTP